MKRNLILLIALVLSCAMILAMTNRMNRHHIGCFLLEDCSYYLRNFKVDIVTSPVETYEDACSAAEEVWREIFSRDKKKIMKYTVLFDSENQVWWVIGSKSINTFGGSPNLLVQTDGKVLAVWHDK